MVLSVWQFVFYGFIILIQLKSNLNILIYIQTKLHWNMLKEIYIFREVHFCHISLFKNIKLNT
ncbi:unnamed protein product [Paramecium sonneborni]|uniref:Uncharacterized protein n=1 Tax=Paramecium sonneborni TaxID=65129 RepID=A0A8S1MR20_9CILI|nr:unnamed protein product [Paramecium sonneborni]